MTVDHVVRFEHLTAVTRKLLSYYTQFTGLVDVLVQIRTRDSLPTISLWSHIEQDRQSAYNVTMRRVLATIVAVEKLYYILSPSLCACVCVRARALSYPVCKTHAPYCHAWSVPAVQYFST